MRVRMRVSMSGARDNREWPGVGEVLDLGDEEAMELSRAGIADIVSGDAGPEGAPVVHGPSGRAVEDVAEHEATQPEGVDERPVERAVDDSGETAATETGSAQRKAARGGRGIQPGQR